MPRFIVDLWLDGYDTEEAMAEACEEFMEEQLNFTASSVRIKRIEDTPLVRRIRPTKAMPKPTQDCEGCHNFHKGKRWGLHCAKCIRNTNDVVDNYSDRPRRNS